MKKKGSRGGREKCRREKRTLRDLGPKTDKGVSGGDGQKRWKSLPDQLKKSIGPSWNKYLH